MLFNVVANLWYWNEIICCFHNKSYWEEVGLLVCSYSNAQNFWYMHIFVCVCVVLGFVFFQQRGKTRLKSSGAQFCPLDDAHPSAAIPLHLKKIFKGMTARYEKRLLFIYMMSIFQNRLWAGISSVLCQSQPQETISRLRL